MRVQPKGSKGVLYSRPVKVNGPPMFACYTTCELTVLGEASFQGEPYFAVHHAGDTHFVYQTWWGVVPGTEVSLVQEEPIQIARRLWPRSKKALRDALAFAQFLAQRPQSQPTNGRLIRELEETLALWIVGPNRALVTHHLARALRPLDRSKS